MTKTKKENSGSGMDKDCSKKIVFLNYLLTCFVVFIHADNRSVAEYSCVDIGGFEWVYQLLGKVYGTAVPTFFALSGYLFFRNLSADTVGRKLKSRIRSVLIPYLFWNISLYAVRIGLSYIPGIGERMNFKIPQLTLKVLLLENHANPPLWYLPILFMLQILSPIVLWLFNRLKKYSIVFVIGLWAVSFWLDWGYFNPLTYAPIYVSGGYIAYFFSEYAECYRTDNWKYYICILLAAFGAYFISRNLFGPVFWWSIMSLIKRAPYKDFMKVSFFIYCSHFLAVLCLRKALTILLGVNPVTMVINYFTVGFVTIAVLTVLGYLFKKKMPKCYSVICGGR